MRSEWIKLRSLRSTPAILGLTVVIGVLLSWILATFVKTDPDTHEIFTVGKTFIFSTWLTTVLAIVDGHAAVHLRGATRHPRQRGHRAAGALGDRRGEGDDRSRPRSGDGHRRDGRGFAGAVLGGLGLGDTSGIASTALWGLLLTTLAPLFGLGVGMIIRHSAAAASVVLVWALSSRT